MNNEAQGVWVGPDGSARPVRMKGGRLFDAFFDHRGGSDNDLGASKTDMALGYATAVWAYRCIKLRRGSKIARVAVMRRLATIIWHMLTHRVAYYPNGPSWLGRTENLYSGSTKGA